MLDFGHLNERLTKIHSFETPDSCSHLDSSPYGAFLLGQYYISDRSDCPKTDSENERFVEGILADRKFCACHDNS